MDWMRVTILLGVKIGKGSILDARCVVTKDVKPYSIMGRESREINPKLKRNYIGLL